jgi:hypothetical protein
MTQENEARVLQRVRTAFRAAVILNWLAVLAILFFRGTPKPVAMIAFTAFRLTAICSTVWLLFEIAEVIAKRTRRLNPFVDAILTLPMYGFWFLAWASTY